MKKWLLMMAMIMCCLVGCGNQKTLPENEPEVEEPATDYVAEYQAQEKKNLINIEWKAEEPEEAENYYRQEEYLAPLFEAKSENTYYGDEVGFGDSYYYYCTDYEDGDCKGFYVEHLNLSTLETEKILYPGDKGGPFGIVYDGEKVYGVFESYNEEGFVDGSVLTELLPDGTFGENMDIYEVSKEKDLLPKEPYYAYQKTVHYCSEKEAMEDSIRIKDIKADKRLVYYPGMFSFNSFSMLQARLEDDCNWVGYPTESGNGNSIRGGMGIAISNTAENKEILEEFVRCMYSFDYLIDDLTSLVPLKTDILDKTVIEKSDWTSDIMIRLSARSYSRAQGKRKDGTSYMNEYMDFLKSCKSGSNAYGEVISIIREEAEPYFMNQKSAEEVQEVIQKRVNLYLNEM